MKDPFHWKQKHRCDNDRDESKCQTRSPDLVYSRGGGGERVRSRPRAAVANARAALYLFFIVAARRLYITWDKLNLNILQARVATGNTGSASRAASWLVWTLAPPVWQKHTYVVVVVVIWFGWVTEKQEADYDLWLILFWNVIFFWNSINFKKYLFELI